MTPPALLASCTTLLHAVLYLDNSSRGGGRETEVLRFGGGGATQEVVREVILC